MINENTQSTNHFVFAFKYFASSQNVICSNAYIFFGKKDECFFGFAFPLHLDMFISGMRLKETS